jgi:L-lactate utilization protein LutC
VEERLKVLKTGLRNNHREQQQKKKSNHDHNIQDLWDTIKKPNLPIRTKTNHPQIYHNQTFNIQNKERILKTAKEKRQVTYKGKPIRTTADFSTQTLNARRLWKDIFQALKENNCQPRLVCPAKLSFLIEGEI